MIDETLLEAEEKMEKTVEVARNEFSGIRSGRANAAMFNAILVDYYGAPTPLQQLGTIAIPEARTVLITPFDRSAMASIDKALRESDLGVNPTDDGTTKFGDEQHNGIAHHYPFDLEALATTANRLAALAETPVYGGDAIITADGAFCIIDFNDWPSFSRCRDEAAKAIIAHVAARQEM